MKKILLTLFCAMTSMFAMAQTVPFEDDLVVTVDGNSTVPQKTTVYLTLNEDMTCNFELKNFMLQSENEDGKIDTMAVGNISIEKLPLTPSAEGYYTFSYDNVLLISEGDAEGVDTWMGPLLEEIPLKLSGKATLEKLFVNIDIDMVSLNQVIHVTFGSDFGADAIKNVKQEGSAKTYDLQGRVVKNPTRGLYIVNGKKVVKS